MSFKIVAVYPIYDEYDSIRGERGVALPNIVQTEAYGHAKVAQLHDQSAGDDVYFRLVPAGGCWIRDALYPVRPATNLTDDLPF